MTIVGVVGGGQLARMMIPAAINLGIELKVFAESSDASARMAASDIGDYLDFDQLKAFANSVDVVTFDHEHVPLTHLLALQDSGAAIFPPPKALELTHDKTLMRAALAQLNIPQPRWAIATEEDSDPLAMVGGFPCIAKLPVGGYDGRGVRVAHSWANLVDWLEMGPVLLEELIDFRRELAQLGARNPSGDWQTWLAVETRQQNGVCAQVISPAQGLSSQSREEAQSIARSVAEAYDVVGVLAVELFETQDGELLVNELAMRPHNSGHVFTEQAETSQFEQHLRAVTDTALGSTKLRVAAGAMVNLFDSAEFPTWQKCASDFPSVKFHSYQKPARPGRKAGHIVATDTNAASALLAVTEAEEAFRGYQS